METGIGKNCFAAHQLEFLVDELENSGYDGMRFPISVKPGMHSKHNSSYWKQQTYWVSVPARIPMTRLSRQHNISNNHLYCKGLESGQIPATIETLSREDKINDFLLTTLRTSWGTDLKKLSNEHQYDLLTIHANYVQKLVENGYASLTNETLILTKSGRLLADKIASDLFMMT